MRFAMAYQKVMGYICFDLRHASSRDVLHSSLFRKRLWNSCTHLNNINFATQVFVRFEIFMFYEKTLEINISRQ